ncbi:MAG: hypothetical protein FWG13_06965 [Leptospirales bacterium]|nr:hypothetical protein [Leptospirales bacterium]
MKRKILCFFAALGIIAALITACEFGTINNTLGGLKYSVRVDNQSSYASIGSIVLNALRAFTPFKDIGSGAKVELYINNLAYVGDIKGPLFLIDNDSGVDMGSKGGSLNNAGWYSVDADLEVKNDVNNGPYSSFYIYIAKLRVDGDEYDFSGSSGKYFGRSPQGWILDFPDNFSGINVTDSTRSIKTVLTVEPDIIGTPNSSGYDSQGLSTEPYKYIKVRGILD